MEGKWTSDLATVLRSHRLQPVTVTCKGDDSSFNVYKHALASQFTQTPLTWKRGSKTFQSRLTFPLKFIPFGEKLCWNCNAPDFKGTAFLHIFFISPMSVDEYKSSVRHLVSEWFAQVSSMADVQWLIVVDSTKAKEKKNRTTLMDKIKSDFSKYQAKVIEVSESVEHGSFSALVQAVQSCVLLHLETLVSSWETRLATKKDQYRDDNWNFIEYFHHVTDFAKLFWSLGALEHSLSIYDDLDRFMSMMVLEAAEDTSREPFWIAKFRKTESTTCPTIRRMISAGLELTISSYLDVRHSLLCQQILLCLHMYYLRSRSKGAAPSIRVDFAVLLLKYAAHCQIAVADHTRLLGFAIPLTRLACWTIFLVRDSLNICGLLSDPTTIAAATSPLCHLHTERFNAMLALCEDELPSDSSLVPWLEKSSLEDGSILIDALKHQTVFLTQLQKIHDTTSTILVQSSRPRIASFIGWRFAKWLSSNGKQDQALPFKLRYLSRLLEDKFCSPQIISMVKEVLPLLSRERDIERILSYLALLSMRASSDEVKSACEEFAKLASVMSKTVLLESITPKGVDLVFATLHSYPRMVHLPLEHLKIEIYVTNNFPVAISGKHCTLKLRGIDYTILTKNGQPVFELVFNDVEQVSRLVSPNFSRLKGSLSPEQSPAKPEIRLTIEETELQPGTNILTFMGEVDKRGCFMIDSLEMVLLQNIRAEFPKLESHKEPALICIGTNPHKVWTDDRTDYLAGLLQTVEIHLEAGCNLDGSPLFVCAGGEEYIEFENASKEWKDKAKYAVPALQYQEGTTVSVPIFVKMDSSMTDSPAVRRVKLLIEWEDRTWLLELPFVALFHTVTRTSQLETQNLLELEISRSLASDWTARIESIRLEICSSDGKPPLLGKLLNSELQDLAPSTVTNLVFLLPLDGDVPFQHTVFMNYRVHSSNEDDQGQSSRLFNFKMEMEMRVRSVSYEICTQMLSQQPGAQLCRADLPCDLVVSLRSLKHNVELLYIVLDADSKLWTLNERAKVLQVKESGLGQIVFSVIPCASGLLPYPSVSVYSCVSVGPRSMDGTEGADVLPGSPLVSFHRTAGKQIRVLGASQNGQRNEEKRAGLKQKFVKLFD